MILIRPAQESDLKELYQLALHLDSMNLPHDKKQLLTFIRVSQASFTHKIQSKQQGRFLFVAENTATGKVVGCSAIFSQHGTQQRPHLYFQIHEEVLKSHYLGRTVHRKYLTLEKKKNGPTEMCSLVVLPRYRRTKHRVGSLLTFSRYLYVWNHPDRFKKRFLSELNGVIRKKDKGNDLWDAMGGHLTGLTYHTADRLSVHSKEFVLSLYPKTKYYIDLLPYKAQRVIGRVGEASQGAKRLLQELGFRFLNQCCPFDGGPHYGAHWDQIKVFKKIKKVDLISGNRKSRKEGFVSFEFENNFIVVHVAYFVLKNKLYLSEKVISLILKKMNVKDLSKVKTSILKWP